MSFGKPAGPELQPKVFTFTEENLERAHEIISYYPEDYRQSAVMPLLWLAQNQHDHWLPVAAMDCVADLIGMPRIRVYEVASFYSMYNPAPVGRFHLQVCTTTPCWLCNSDSVLKAIYDETGLKPGKSTDDGMFTLTEVECLGACVNAPMMQVNDDYYEDLDYENTLALLRSFRSGGSVRKGSQKKRQGSMAQTGPTTLIDRMPEHPVGPGGGKMDGSPLEAAGGPAPEVQVAHDRAMYLASGSGRDGKESS